MPACLVPQDNGRRPIVLDKPIILVGRHPDCDVVLKNSRKVSRKHCCFVLVNNDCMVRDLGSMNGVWVNQRRVERVAHVQMGDTVAVGDVLYRLREDSLNEQVPSCSDVRRERDPSSRPSDAPQKSQGPAEVPHELSQDIPVPISEHSDEFWLEAAYRKTPESVPLIDDDDARQPLRDDEDDEDQISTQ